MLTTFKSKCSFLLVQTLVELLVQLLLWNGEQLSENYFPR